MLKKNDSGSLRILLIMPNFFDYPSTIKKELEAKGYVVDLFDDRPSTNPWIKAAVRFKRDNIKKYIEKYFSKIMQVVSTQNYRYLFLISGQSLSFTEEMFKRLKENQQDAEFVLYQWDSLKNFPYIKKMYKFFDRIYTFDKGDAQREKINFLPLFYSKKYEEISQADIPIKYDTLFIGTAHPQKYYFIKRMVQQLENKYKRQYIYFFFPSRLVYLYRKVFNPEFKNAHYSEFHFIPLSGKQIDKLYSESNIILDSPQKGQNGLTIRVIETLGAQKKLITTNEDVINYDFYRPENIYIYKGSFDFDNPFFKEKYQHIDYNIYKKYSLKNWLTCVLRDN